MAASTAKMDKRNKSRPALKDLTGALMPRDFAAAAVPSPRSPLDLMNMVEPGLQKYHDNVVWVGQGTVAALQKSDFLSFCDWCCKSLDDKDIYIYKGEEAFCSEECRNMQIEIDEREQSY